MQLAASVATSSGFLGQSLADTHWPHTLLELLAYFIGARLYWRHASTLNALASTHRSAQPDPRARWLMLACLVCGAGLGSKALHIAEHLPALLAQPDLAPWLSGKSVLGGFLGGTVGVELGKRWVGWRRSTGDAWVIPLTVGLVIGRMGCQLSGPWDQTYGAVMHLPMPWAWNYGDGLPRHPVALYEILAIIAMTGILRYSPTGRRWQHVAGAHFAAWMLGYCLLRLLLEGLKPPFGAADSLIAGGLPTALWPISALLGLPHSTVDATAIQVAAFVGAIAYAGLLRYRLTQP